MEFYNVHTDLFYYFGGRNENLRLYKSFNSGSDGIKAAAKKRGVIFGRPSKKLPEDFVYMVESWRDGKMPLTDISKKSGISESTFYRRIRQLNNMDSKNQAVKKDTF